MDNDHEAIQKKPRYPQEIAIHGFQYDYYIRRCLYFKIYIKLIVQVKVIQYFKVQKIKKELKRLKIKEERIKTFQNLIYTTYCEKDHLHGYYFL